MQHEYLQLFFGTIDLSVIAVAVVVCIIMTILKKVLKNKLKTSITVYLPTILAVVLLFLIKFILNGFDEAFTLDTVYNGLIAGSVSTVISVIIARVIKGKPISSPCVMIIEGILDEIIKKEHMQSVTNEILLVVEEDGDDQTKTRRVSEIIFNYTNLEMDDQQRETLSLFILKSVSAIKK